MDYTLFAPKKNSLNFLTYTVKFHLVGSEIYGEMIITQWYHMVMCIETCTLRPTLLTNKQTPSLEIKPQTGSTQKKVNMAFVPPEKFWVPGGYQIVPAQRIQIVYCILGRFDFGERILLGWEERERENFNSDRYHIVLAQRIQIVHCILELFEFGERESTIGTRGEREF